MKRKFFFKNRSLHDNPVVDKILRKREEGLCEKAAGLATVFQEVTDFDIAMLYSRSGDAPTCLNDNRLACMGETLYKAVLTCFSQIPDLTKSAYLWEVNAEIINKSEDKIRTIRQLIIIYSKLEYEFVNRIVRSYGNIENDTKKLIENIIKSKYEVYNKRL